MNQMHTISIEEFQQNFDELIERVESGESFIISSEYGSAMIVPYTKDKSTADDLIRIHTEHDEAC